jgi:drug/metabolite transporter (DMT)-like permease
MIGVAVAMRRSLPRGRSLTGALLYGLFGFTAAYGLIYTGIRDVPAGTTMVLISLTPLFTFFLAIAHRQEPFHLQGLLGAVVAVVGVGIVFVDQIGADVPIFSLLLIILGTAGIAESGVIVKGIPRADPFSTNGVAMLLGGALLLGLSVLSGEPQALPAAAETWLAVAYLVILGSIALFALYVFALQRWTASAVSYVTLLMPIVTVGVAAMIGAEPITPPFVVGATVILGGVYLGAFLPRRPDRSTAISVPECLPAADEPEAAAPASSTG